MLLLRNLMLSCLLLVAVGEGVRYLARPASPRVYLPAYECVVPSDIPAGITNHGGENCDVHALYRNGHREGWDECLAEFVHNRCGRKLRHRGPTFSSDLDVPFRKGSFSMAPFEGRRDGYDACRRCLGMPDPSFGRSTVVKDPNWDDGWRFGDYRFADSQASTR